MTNQYVSLLIATAMAIGVSAVRAQESVPPTKDEAMPGMDHSQMDHGQMKHGDAPADKPKDNGHA